MHVKGKESWSSSKFCFLK